jgi:hypothetical protein
VILAIRQSRSLLIVQMPLNHGQGNAGGEAGGNDRSINTRDSHYLRRKRKPLFEEAESIQSSQPGEQSYATFTPDDSDGEAIGLSATVRDDYPVFKKHKATTQSLLSGTAMEELCVEIPPKINSPPMYPPILHAVTGDQPLDPGKSKSFSTPSRTPPIRHLVNDFVGNAASVAPKEKGHIEARTQAGLSGSRSDETNGMIFVVPSSSTKHH